MSITYDERRNRTYISPLIEVAALESVKMLCDSGNRHFGHGDADDWFKWLVLRRPTEFF